MNGRGHHKSRDDRTATIYANPRFTGLNPKLPILNYGSPKDMRAMEFLRLMGEHCAVTYKPSIAEAFCSLPPEYGETDEAPPYPDIDPDADLDHTERAQINEWLNDKKMWTADQKKIRDDMKTVFSVVYGQLSESSRCEIEDDAEWDENFRLRDTLYLITRIRATHIAVQSGNTLQDQERVRSKWFQMKMRHDQSSFDFRRQVEEYQLERQSVGLEILPETELVIGILNRLDQTRYSSLVRDYLDNERRGIAELPTASTTLWKEIKDSQIIRFRSAVGAHETVYLAKTEQLNNHAYLTRADDENPRSGHRGGRGGGRNNNRSGRGRGRGRPYTPYYNNDKSAYNSPAQSKPSTTTELSAPPVKANGDGLLNTPTSITPRNIICWNCGKKGHKQEDCHSRKTYYSQDKSAFLTSILEFNPNEELLITGEECTTPVLLSTNTTVTTSNQLLLDTQASIHIICNGELLNDITKSTKPVTVQGITKDVINVNLRGTLKTIDIEAYYCPDIAANIISYSQLRRTHTCSFKDDNDIFEAIPRCSGPTLIFHNINGHYTLEVSTMEQLFLSSVASRSLRYNTKQLRGAQRAYDFLHRMGYISYKAAAEVLRRSSLSRLGFTRQDLVTCQDVYGQPAEYIQGHGTQRSINPGDDDMIPVHESVEQDLHIDLFFMFGQVFFLSISVLMGLIMVTHLGSSQSTTAEQKSKSKAGAALLEHIQKYKLYGFTVKRVTSDGEPSIRAIKSDVENIGVALNLLGHGSHAPHAEAAIRHVKNKARSTKFSLPYELPSRWAPALITFVVHTINMVPRSSSPGHISAYTSFTGRIPNFEKHAPFAFGTPGFLQRANGPLSNTANTRGDYGIWLGTTRNLAGTHTVFNLSTLHTMNGDIFRPAPLTPEAAARISRLAGALDTSVPIPSSELSLPNPSPFYPLDPNRGVHADLQVPPSPIVMLDPPESPLGTLTTTPTLTPSEEHEQEIDTAQLGPVESDPDVEVQDENEENHEQVMFQVSQLLQAQDDSIARTHTQPYNVFAAMSIKEATTLYGQDPVRQAGRTELLNCINKGVWRCLPTTYIPHKPIPSKLFLTPKMTASGEFKLLKGRIVGGGHRQDTSMFLDSEVSSPTVSLTSVMIGAAMAAHQNLRVMTLDHTAAYLNADMKGPDVDMILNQEVTEMLCEVEPANRHFVRSNGKIIVRLKKALYGCVQSAVLWYEELKTTLLGMKFIENPYDICSFSRNRGTSIDKILVYVDDLFITSDSDRVLDEIDTTLRFKYGGVTSKKGPIHEYLGIMWDFTTQGEVSMRMDGYIKDIFKKYTVTRTRSVPANENLFTISNDSPELSTEKRENFHSIVMTLHYLAKRIRTDILTAVSWCASRVLHPTEEDELKLDRILEYLMKTKDRATVLRIGDKLELRAYVDASYAVYHDAKSVSGVVLMLGEAVIYVKSSKQKIVTRSSTEAELVAISDSLSQVLWTREYMLSSGVPLGPVILYQDNLSTIFLANKGRSTNEKTRHIKIRYFFIHHYIDMKEITIVHMPTAKMIADIMTKPLHGALFNKLSAVLSGMRCLIE
jgi:Reverse transcriptase (RNA-dependent DNA polymerase)